ncbi:Uncharacterized protein SCF082_LOCUS39198 [Durusdinium trenchii]|uniref:DUF1254 domain-containing protein n=1 Tax=Durusdinium trenchii TaxID=1381693 RepID=A0ABP0Q2M8_9DINO
MSFGKVPEGITTRAEYDTCLGKLRFQDGLPDEATVQKVYDDLDRSRAKHAFLDMIPMASMEAMRAGFAAIGCDACHKACLYGNLMDSRSLWLTGNTEAVYVGAMLDLQRDGPTVIEVPAGAGPGLVNDAYFRYVGDMGKPGPDKGAGGKYLVLPPGYDAEVPGGFYVFRTPSYTNWVILRGFLQDGSPEPAAKMWTSGLKIYPLSSSSSPPSMEFLDMSGKEMNTIHSNDFGFFKEVNAVIQREPAEFLDPELRGTLSAIGIRKGCPFQPDERMKALLEEGVALGNATARALCFAPRDKSAKFYGEGSEWQTPWVGGDYQWLVDQGVGGRNQDARTRFFYLATGNTPAMVLKMVGVGSQYVLAFRDEKHEYMDGGKCYSLTLPPNVPCKDFWSLVLYDAQHRSMLQTPQLVPGRNSVRHPDMKTNTDGSMTVWFAPEAPVGKESNWLQTTPGKTWFVCLRLYGPLEPWFNQTWRPSEIRQETDRKRKAPP